MTAASPITRTVDRPPDGYYGQVRPEVVALVPEGARRVLDCGCGEGRLGESLRARGCHVTGVEIDPLSAAAAQQRLDRVIPDSIEAALPLLAPGSFDCIICADVLEHLLDPWSVVRQLADRVSPGGTFICSVPNVRHLALVIDLALRGRWTYRESGVLDRTHLRFFTRRTAVEMIEAAGLRVQDVKANRESFRGALGLAARCLRPFSAEFGVAQWLITSQKPL